MVGFVPVTNTLRWGFENPRLAWRTVLLGAVLGIPALGVWWSFVHYAKPEIPLLQGVTVAADGHGGTVMELDYSTRLTDHCLTVGVHVMSLVSKGERTKYEFLSGSLRGGGLGGSVPEFTLVLHIPPGVAPGDWKMINRIDSSCPPLRLAHYDHTSKPVTVRIADGVVTIPRGQWFEHPEGYTP